MFPLFVITHRQGTNPPYLARILWLRPLQLVTCALRCDYVKIKSHAIITLSIIECSLYPGFAIKVKVAVKMSCWVLHVQKTKQRLMVVHILALAIHRVSRSSISDLVAN